MQNQGRIDMIFGSLKVWYYSYTFGIPWGDLELYLYDVSMILPHNWLLISLIHGGTISFLALTVIYCKYILGVIKMAILRKLEKGYYEIIILIISLILISALLEQVYLLVPVNFILYILIGFSTQVDNDV